MMSDGIVPLKVTFVCYNVYPLVMMRSGGFGGAELDLWNVARELARDARFHVSLVTVAPDLRSPTTVEGVALVPVPPHPDFHASTSVIVRKYRVFAYYTRLFTFLRRLRSDVYFSKLASLESVTTYLASKSLHRRFFFRVEHDWETDFAAAVRNIFLGSHWQARAFFYSLKRASKVICQTSSQQSALLSGFGVHSQIVPNAHEFTVSENCSRERSTVIWVGRCHPMKRPLLFIELAKKLPHLGFVMVMPPNGSDDPLFASVAAAAAGLENMELIPGLPQTEVLRRMAQARLFVLTSEAEGYSNVIIEAMRNATPVVSLSVNPDGLLLEVPASSDPDPAWAQAVGFCAAGNLDMLGKLVSTLSNDDNSWVVCSENALEMASRRFDVRKVVDEYKLMLLGAEAESSPA